MNVYILNESHCNLTALTHVITWGVFSLYIL